MVRHDGETMQLIFALLAISDKRFQEELRVRLFLKMTGLKKSGDRDGIGALLCGHAGKHTLGLKPLGFRQPLRPKPEGLGYLIVAGTNAYLRDEEAAEKIDAGLKVPSATKVALQT